MEIIVRKVEKEEGGSVALVELVITGDNLLSRIEALMAGFDGVAKAENGLVVVSIQLFLKTEFWDETADFLEEHLRAQFKKR